MTMQPTIMQYGVCLTDLPWGLANTNAPAGA